MSTPKTPKNGCPKSSLTPRSPVKVQTTITSFVNRAAKRKELEDPESQGASKIPKPTNPPTAGVEEMAETNTEIPSQNLETNENPNSDTNAILKAISDFQSSSQNNFTIIRSEVKSLSTRIDEIKTECLKRIQEVEDRVAKLEKEIKTVGATGLNQEQEKELTSMKDALELLRIEARSNNLLIYGLAEKQGEVEDDITNDLTEIFQSHYGVQNPVFFDPHRLKQPPGVKKPRAVKISFRTRDQRNAILFKRVKDRSPIIVKADLPPETANKQKIFAKFAKQAADDGRSYKRFDTHVIMEGKKYNFDDAKKYLETNRPHIPPSQNYSPRPHNSNSNFNYSS